MTVQVKSSLNNFQRSTSFLFCKLSINRKHIFTCLSENSSFSAEISSPSDLNLVRPSFKHMQLTCMGGMNSSSQFYSFLTLVYFFSSFDRNREHSSAVCMAPYLGISDAVKLLPPHTLQSLSENLWSHSMFML